MTPIAMALPIAILSVLAWFAPEPVPEEFIEKFRARYERVENPPTLEEYANVEKFDARYMGEALEQLVAQVPDNDQWKLAWGGSYRMMTYNEMARATREEKYLVASQRMILAALALRDDQTGTPVHTGEILPNWSASRKSPWGRCVYTVHTGMITYPMLDYAWLAREFPDYYQRNRSTIEKIVQMAEESVNVHDEQWRDGPGEEEGHYVWRHPHTDGIRHIRPYNWQSAMGRSHWLLHKLGAGEPHGERAVRLAWFAKRRMAITSTGAYDWAYTMPAEPFVEGATMAEYSEDINHAALSASFPILMGHDGVVFDHTDLVRFGKTVTEEFGRHGDGVFCSTLRCQAESSAGGTAVLTRWLRVTDFWPQVFPLVAEHYLNYVPDPGMFNMAMLIRYKQEYDKAVAESRQP